MNLQDIFSILTRRRKKKCNKQRKIQPSRHKQRPRPPRF